MLYKFFFKIGERLRNPSIKHWFAFLKKSEYWSVEVLEAYQLKQFKALLQFAYQYSPFYKTLFDENKINIHQIKTLNDIVKIPILEKKDLLNNVQDIHTKYPFKKRMKATTSGSSGEPLVFYREEAADSFNRASIFRGYSWYNIKPWHKNGYFWGFDFSLTERIKTKILDALQHRFRIFGYEKQAFEHFVKKLKHAHFVHGYSSMLFQTAKLINEKNLPKPQKIKMVKGTSEKIFETYQQEVKNAFGVKIISEYGATESGIIAFECPAGNMHINMEGVLVESHQNEILVTNLQMRSFPIIRYKLGDYIELAPENEVCSCGKKHRILKEVTGRVGASVYGKKNLYPSLYFYYIFKNLVKTQELKLNYQVLQNKKGSLVFKIAQHLSSKQLGLLETEIEKYFKQDMVFKIETNAVFKSNNGKFKSFISNI